jgi:Subtilase family
VKAIAIPNDQYYSQLWGMQKISAPAAWDISAGARSMVAAIIDTGVSYTHPDLASNIWSAPTAFTVTVGGSQISCPAGSHGLNAITTTCDPADDNGHGSHVAGTIGAAGNNGLGVVGLNWTASIMALKFLDSTGSGSVSDAINSIEFAIQVKSFFAATSTPVNVRVLSNSWGGSGFSQALLDEINSAGADEMLFVAAAGNAAANDDVTKNYPASYAAANQISVAATDSNDALASFSSYGPTTVHLGAPGVSILSTYLAGNYATLSGTSMATPHVAGAALLLLSACPSLNTAALKNSLLTNVDTLPNLSGLTVSGGRLNVSRAIQACNLAAPQAQLSSLTITPATIQTGQSGTITVMLTGPAGVGGAGVNLASSYTPGINVPPAVTVPQGASTTIVSFTAGVVTVPTAFTLTASYLGVNKTSSGVINPATGGGSPLVNYLGTDTTTQGNWKSKYGAEGYSVVGDSTVNPAYVTPLSSGAQYIWSPSTTDVRALQKSSGTDRIAATWYGQPSFTVDLNFTDQNSHRVAIYAIDWDSYGPRMQTVDVLDSSNNVLDTHTLSSFVTGQYLVWNVTGHVKIRATGLTTNSVISGIFFGGASLSGATANFLGFDTTTQGNWKSKYGAEGYSVVGDSTVNPAYVTPLSSGAQYIWSPSTTDVRALQKSSGTDRIAATWYGQPSFTVDLNFTDQNSHRVAIYAIDWDSYGPRMQTVDVLDSSNNVLDTHTLSSFVTGQYLVWNVTGHVKIRATGLTTNSVISGIFFGGASLSGATANFLGFDTTTQGNWKSKYGAEGYSVVGDSTVNPAYVTPASSGSQYIWSASTTDVRALQKSSGTDRIAATWYGQPSFTIDLNFTDQNSHRVAIYAIDYDSYGPRMQTVDVLDSSNNVLDTHTLSSFVAGQYLVWNVTGHVKIRATGLTTNSVISGIFFR